MASYRRVGTNLYDLVDRFFNDGFSINTPLKNIILDVQEFDDKYIVEADVPGVDKKDIHITFNNDYLKISLESDHDMDDKIAGGKGTGNIEEHSSSSGKSMEKVMDTNTASSKTTSAEGHGSEKSADHHEANDKKHAAHSGSTKGSAKDKENGGNYIHRERIYTMVSRVIYLKDATSKGIKAELKDGVLKLTVPKREDAMNQNQTIPIE